MYEVQYTNDKQIYENLCSQGWIFYKVEIIDNVLHYFLIKEKVV